MLAKHCEKLTGLRRGRATNQIIGLRNKYQVPREGGGGGGAYENVFRDEGSRAHLHVFRFLVLSSSSVGPPILRL